MEDKVKHIVSQYIKIPAEKITPLTVIDRSAVASSIILHRMYAQLANEGILVSDYSVVNTFGQLSEKINGKETTTDFAETIAPVHITVPENISAPAIGIDTESISSMPVVSDFREDAFYTMNFAPVEIAYCILQPNPYASFAGLFAAKEAIIKADNTFKNTPFNTLIIDHLPEGKPVYNGFQLSISHTNDTALAVAVKNLSLPVPTLSLPGNNKTNTTIITLAAVGAFLLSLATLILFLLKKH